MAFELRRRPHPFHPAVYSTSPPPPSYPSWDRHHVSASISRSVDDNRPDNIGLSAAQALSIMTGDINVRKMAAITDGDYAPTPPIDVPASFLQDDRPYPSPALHLDGKPYAPSPLDNFLRNKRTSINFNPQVILDCGQRRALEEPLPKLEIDTRLPPRSIRQDQSRDRPGSLLVRAYSEADQSTFHPLLAAEPINQSPLDLDETESSLLAHQPHLPSAPSTISSLTNSQGQTDLEGASLTSDSTSFSIPSEIKTPKDDYMASIVPARSNYAAFHSSTSLQDVNEWPSLPRQASAPRAKSYSFNRKGDIRPDYRSGSRRSTASAHSPASAFLSRFAREEVTAAPDDEGQEVGEYVLGRQVGFGGSSVVKEAFTIEGDARVCRAVKIMRKHVAHMGDLENERFQAEFEREVGLWRCLSHRHVLSLIAVHVTPFATFCFTPLSCGGTLFDLVRGNRQGLRGDVARRYSYQLASAIRYLHEDMRVIHRDIKLENCLVHRSTSNAGADGGDLLLCDFGLAEFEGNDHVRNPHGESGADARCSGVGRPVTNTSFVGSLEYASPELIMGPPGFMSRTTDVWALGVVIYTLLLGDLPFQHSLPSRVQQKILAGEWDTDALRLAAGVAGVEAEVVETVHGCLQMRSEERWVIRQVLDSRWLNGCPEMLAELSGGWTN